MRTFIRPLYRGLITAVAVATLVAAGPVLGAGAAVSVVPMILQADAPPLGLVALEQNGSFFEATIAAGSAQTFDVDRINPNDSVVAARTYVGVVSTIVNGGFGAADSTAVASGASTWVDYPAETLTLQPQQHNAGTFTVAVPANTAPGQYVSSIVLENAVADAGTGQLALARITRQAVAISIRVPGALQPAFSLGRASLGETAGLSVVSVNTSNDGNQHLAPEGTMTVSSHGEVISTHPITMGSLCAGMSTQVAVTLGSQLAPGDYTMSLTLTDPLTGVAASVLDVPLSVAVPDLFEQGTQLFAPITGLVPPVFTPLLIGLIVAGVLGLLAVGTLGVRRLVLRHRARVVVQPVS
ncbi:hypothetical protein E3O25_00420 [Cryobacterium sp. TMT1-3]|uniref:hypothetical protein n=1 Tax=Cryobacterium sp. TMT1-3 TaxID=1259237 RepID=UPI00106D2466|nr:hypothetical protein [Cryobacterium sp. TMT1-3]TFC31589.1 hypothetical protein E3O25_00420 [Cryobacterium sp. TMT1-3]